MPAEGGEPNARSTAAPRRHPRPRLEPGRPLAGLRQGRWPTTTPRSSSTTRRRSRSTRSPARWTDDYSPAWDPDGRYLYFSPTARPTRCSGPVDLHNVETSNEKLYALLLRQDVENPLLQDGGPAAGGGEGRQEGRRQEGQEGREGREEGRGAERRSRSTSTGWPTASSSCRWTGAVTPRPGATATHLFYVSLPLQGMAERPGLLRGGGPDGHR